MSKYTRNLKDYNTHRGDICADHELVTPNHIWSSRTTFNYQNWSGPQTIFFRDRLVHTKKYVTGFWKTNQNVTLGQLHFLGPTNSHTHTLSMHRCNTRLSCLVCFSRADFADHVKPQLRQCDPWRVLDGRYWSDIHPCVSETSHRPSRLVKAYD